MPILSLTLPEQSEAISRPVVFDIIGQIQEITKIRPDTKIFFPGDIQKMQTPSTSIDSKDDRFATFNTNNIVFIEVEEDYDHETLGTTVINRKEHPAVFIDDALGIRLCPIYATSNVVINFKYRCVSKTEAMRWRDDIRMRISQLRDINLHDINYHYLLPLELLILIKAIHETKEVVEPYDESYVEYVSRCATPRLTVVGDLVNQDARLAIAERQCRIVGMYGFDGIPEKPERDDNGTWLITFSYKFSYEKPIGCTMRYPIMVHNNLIPKNYTYFNNKSYDLYPVVRSASLSIDALSGFESDTIMDNRRYPYPLIRLPEFDDYEIKSIPVGTGSVFLALCEVDLADKRSLVNLNELGDLIIDQDILEFIRVSEQPYMCKIYKSIFHLSLYRNDSLTSNDTITLLPDLTVKATSDLNLRHQHRVRLSIVMDLTLLSREALDRLRKYPKVLTKVIEAMNEIFKNHPDLVKLANMPYVTELQFSRIYALLTGYSLDNGTGTTRGTYYDTGLRVRGWPDPRFQVSDVFKDIDPRILEQYRRNRVGMNNVMCTGIITFNKA